MKIIITARKNERKENKVLIHHLIRLAVILHNAKIIITQ